MGAFAVNSSAFTAIPSSLACPHASRVATLPPCPSLKIHRQPHLDATAELLQKVTVLRSRMPAPVSPKSAARKSLKSLAYPQLFAAASAAGSRPSQWEVVP